MALVRKHVLIRGRVQGVAFRAFTRSAARRAGVCGWVRNLFDGAVEAVLEGEGAQVESVLNRLRQGPPMSRVEHVSTLDEPATGEFTDFDITYSAGDWRL